MLYFNYNGKILEAETPIATPDNRGLRYGDGLFETIKYKNARLILLDEHFARLWKGMQLLQFEPSKLFTPDFLQKEILQLVNKNKQAEARVRITVVRGSGGLYDAKNHLPNYIIQSWPLASNSTVINENGLQLCIYPDAKKSLDAFSNSKHNNFLPYFMGALTAKKNHCNDAIILNSNGNIADTTIANIFIIKDRIIYTPSLGEGCIAGVMRKCILQELQESGYILHETALTTEALMNADEVFLTNSIYNIRWVAGIGAKKYSNEMVRKIYEQLSQTNKVVFC